MYHAGLSNCSMRVRIALEEKRLKWISHEIDLGHQENLKDWYLAINPKGLVPAIVDDGVVVTESADILYYLEDKFPEPSLLSADPTLAAEAKEWVDLAASLHMKAIKTWVYGSTGGASKNRSDMAHYADIQPDKSLIAFHQHSLDGFSDAEIEVARKMLADVFARMENRLQDHAYLVGDAQSLADVAWLPQYVLLNMLGFDFRPYPGILVWAKHQQERPSYQAAVGVWMPKVPGWAVRIGVQLMRFYRKLKPA
ncbi:Tetrachloro-P-hydroquinone reductive dehalogenase [Thalassovita gelatinovora]|uniref:Tetrachloro-P-hydroquinone reductive dehalogenase n=1 Tax=Thalassovita gelatinovora TaxID=53501 RepID=A0A0P1FI15_THAGE|nr:glutathione S-transferase family protein [Thalassovita gelatinovora]QIZ81977.1 glutathione S-transferase family protein [Thalassovita gelatinovora]CUH67412.1 Tetrachloro-P-hydroquinone reductive dehalogenase [Thalassovita gelatinovora]SEP74597.1 glutathione S-transferase [Thalassovita gelatinovora]